MSANENQFDGEIRKKLETYREEAPIGVWNQLESKIAAPAGFNVWSQLNSLLIIDVILLITGGLIAGLSGDVATKSGSGNSAVITQTITNTKQGIDQPAPETNDEKGIAHEELNTTLAGSSTTLAESSSSQKENEIYKREIKKVVHNFYIPPVFHVINPSPEKSRNNLPEAITSNEEIAVVPTIDLTATKARIEAIEEQTREYFKYLERHPPEIYSNENPYNESVDIELMLSPLLNLNKYEYSPGTLDLKREGGKWNANYSFGIRIRGSITPHLFFKTGVLFTQTEDRLSVHRKEERTFEQIDSIQGFILFPFDPPLPITVYDTNLIHQTITNDFQTLLRIQRTDIPMLIGYQFNAGKLRMEMIAGILFNISLSGKGVFPGVEINDELTVNNNGNNTLRKQTAASLYGGFAIAMAAGKNTELFAEPYYMRATNTATVKNSVVSLRSDQAGLNIGVRYRFQKN